MWLYRWIGLSLAPSRKPKDTSEIRRNPHLRRFVRISQAPNCNSMPLFDIRQVVQLCRLVRRPVVTLWYIER
jgi:hypothetical protein